MFRTAAAFAAVLAAGAAAETVKFNGTGMGNAIKVVVTDDALADALGITSRNVFAGLMSWDLTGLGYGSEEMTVCTELSQQVSGGRTYDNYSIRALEEAPDPQIPFAVGDETASAVARLFEHGLSLVTDNWSAAAFQAAVWEAFYDGVGSMDLAAGDMTFRKTNNSAFSAGSGFAVAFDAFAAIMQDTDRAVQGSVFAISSPTNQDQVVYTTGPSPVAVPMPTAGLLAGVGLTLTAIRRRR